MLTGPQCHPVDTSAGMPVRWTAVSTPQPALTVAIPGTTSHFASTQGAYARRLKAILSNPSAVLTRRLRITAPFAAGDHTIEVPPFESVEADNRIAAKADSVASVSAVNTEAASLLRSIQAPASFIARCGCVCGDRVMWGNLTPLPPATVDLTNICTFDSSLTGQWTAEVRIALRGGRELAYTVSGSGSAPDRQKPGDPLYPKAWKLAGHGRDRAQCHDAAMPFSEDSRHQRTPAGTGGVGNGPQPCRCNHLLAFYDRQCQRETGIPVSKVRGTSSRIGNWFG